MAKDKKKKKSNIDGLDSERLKKMNSHIAQNYEEAIKELADVKHEFYKTIKVHPDLWEMFNWHVKLRGGMDAIGWSDTQALAVLMHNYMSYSTRFENIDPVKEKEIYDETQEALDEYFQIEEAVMISETNRLNNLERRVKRLAKLNKGEIEIPRAVWDFEIQRAIMVQGIGFYTYLGIFMKDVGFDLPDNHNLDTEEGRRAWGKGYLEKDFATRIVMDSDMHKLVNEYCPTPNTIKDKVYDYAIILRDVPSLEHYFLTNKAKDENYKGKNPNETKFDRDFRNRVNALVKNKTVIKQQGGDENWLKTDMLSLPKDNTFNELYKGRLSDDLEFDSTGIKNCFDNFLQEVEKRVEKGVNSVEINKEIKKEFIED